MPILPRNRIDHKSYLPRIAYVVFRSAYLTSFQRVLPFLEFRELLNLSIIKR